MNGTLSKLVWGFFRGKTETKKKEKLSQCGGVFSEKIVFTLMFSGFGFYSSRQHITHMEATLCSLSISSDLF